MHWSHIKLYLNCTLSGILQNSPLFGVWKIYCTSLNFFGECAGGEYFLLGTVFFSRGNKLVLIGPSTCYLKIFLHCHHFCHIFITSLTLIGTAVFFVWKPWKPLNAGDCRYKNYLILTKQIFLIVAKQICLIVAKTNIFVGQSLKLQNSTLSERSTGWAINY